MRSWKGCRTAAVIILSASVGGALIQDGKLYRGAHLFAGKFSYVHTNQDAFDRKDNVLAVRCGCKTLRAAAAERLSRRAETKERLGHRRPSRSFFGIDPKRGKEE